MYRYPTPTSKDIKCLGKVYDQTIKAQNVTDLDETFEILKGVCNYYPSPVFPQLLRSDYFRKGLWDEGWGVEV